MCLLRGAKKHKVESVANKRSLNNCVKGCVLLVEDRHKYEKLPAYITSGGP